MLADSFVRFSIPVGCFLAPLLVNPVVTLGNANSRVPRHPENKKRGLIHRRSKYFSETFRSLGATHNRCALGASRSRLTIN